MPWSAEEMLDEQFQRVDIPAHARIAHNGLLQKNQNILGEDLHSTVHHVPLTTQLVNGLDRTELNNACNRRESRLQYSPPFPPHFSLLQADQTFPASFYLNNNNSTNKYQ